MNFKIRKIIATVVALVSISVAFFHSSEFGMIILVLSLLMLGRIVFRKFFAKYSDQIITMNDPGLLEFFAWIGLLAVLLFILFAKYN